MATAIKLSDELARAARAEARLASRSMTQQIEYWARIGRTIDRTDVVSRDRVRAALSAQLEFDALTTEARMVALSALDEVVSRPEGDAELAAFLGTLANTSGLDEDGRLVHYDADGKPTRVDDADAYSKSHTGE